MPIFSGGRDSHDYLERAHAARICRLAGATDELRYQATGCVHPIRDLHVTLLRRRGLDDSKLLLFHAGRFKQFSQSGGQVIDNLLA